jgi:hypothetical protein
VVVGSNLDLSSTFYNPGASALSKTSSLVLTTSAAELISISVQDGAGEGKDLSSVRLASAPSIFAVSLSPGKSRHQWALSYLTRYDFDFEVDARRVDPADPPTAPADPDVYAEAVFDQRLSEPWVGISWAYRTNQHVGVGATMYTAIRSHRGRFQVIGEAAESDSVGAAAIAISDFRYWNVRLLWKAGVFFDHEPLKTGLAVTTPSIGLFGDGSTGVDVFTTGLDVDNDGIMETNLVADYQEGLGATYKSPFSVALGASYALGATSLFVTVESFGGIESYSVLDPQPFVSQTSGDTVSTRYTLATKAVTNWGLGVEHHLGERTSFYGGWITDRSSLVRDPETLLSTVAAWDIYHLALGSTFGFATLDFTLGGNYSWGSQATDQLPDVNDPGSGLVGSPVERTVKYRRFRLIFGVTVGI